MSRALINVPAKARKGEVIQIRTLVQHEMETGFRPLPNGGFAPRHGRTRPLASSHLPRQAGCMVPDSPCLRAAAGNRHRPRPGRSCLGCTPLKTVPLPCCRR